MNCILKLTAWSINALGSILFLAGAATDIAQPNGSHTGPLYLACAICYIVGSSVDLVYRIRAGECTIKTDNKA